MGLKRNRAGTSDSPGGRARLVTNGIAVGWPPLVAWVPDTFFWNAGVALWWWGAPDGGVQQGVMTARQT